MMKFAIRFMNLQNSNAKKSDFVALMREIVKETEKVPYQSRIGVQYLNRIMKISFYKVRKSKDIDYQAVCRIVNHWKEIILVKSLKFLFKKILFFDFCFFSEIKKNNFFFKLFKVDKYIEDEIEIPNDENDEDLITSLGRKCALDRKSPAHIELTKIFIRLGDYEKACRQIKKFLNFSDSYKSVEGNKLKT